MIRLQVVGNLLCRRIAGEAAVIMMACIICLKLGDRSARNNLQVTIGLRDDMKNISVRVEDEFHQQISQAAKAKEMALSDFVRASLQAKCQQDAGQEQQGPLLDNLNRQLETLGHQLTEKDEQIREVLKQHDHAQQIIAMQQNTLSQMTEQNRLLLDATQEKEEKQVGFWGRLIGQRA